MSTATITEDWTLVNQVYTEPHPLKVGQRKTVLYAIFATAREHDGLVHASWLRTHLPKGEVNEHLPGNVMSQLAKAGVLVRTGAYMPSLDAANRNNTRDLPVRRVADWRKFADVILAVK